MMGITGGTWSIICVDSQSSLVTNPHDCRISSILKVHRNFDYMLCLNIETLFHGMSRDN